MSTAAHGIVQVIVDPRTTLLQSLEAILIAELADNACWEALIPLAAAGGEDPLVQPFEEALVIEQETYGGARVAGRGPRAQVTGSMEGGKPTRADDTAAEYSRGARSHTLLYRITPS